MSSTEMKWKSVRCPGGKKMWARLCLFLPKPRVARCQLYRKMC